MDNAVIIDGVIDVVLVAGILVGAHRGLFKSLMGLLAVLAALIGASVLANMLTPMVTELVYPIAREKLIAFFSSAQPTSDGASALFGGIADQLSRFGLSVTELDPYRSAVSAAEQAAMLLISSVVHSVLLLALYIVLLIVLRMLVRALDRVFDLPLLSTVNNLGGAAFGFAEAALLLYVAVYLASRFGAAFVTEHANDTYLLPIFLSHSPVELISSFTQKG